MLQLGEILQEGEIAALEILNGRYGPYIAYKGNNYKIPKDIVPQDLSLHSCMELIRIQDEKGVTSAPKKKFAKKK